MSEKIEKPETPEDAQKPTDPPAVKEAEKTLSQSEVNALMAKERKSYEAKLKATQEEFATFKKQIEDKQAEAEAAAKEKVEKLREGLPENLTALLDKLTATDQLEWLSDPTNTITKQTIKPLPEAREGERRAPSIGTIV
jgi:molecular chaperone GrpE (heat shock protein)